MRIRGFLSIEIDADKEMCGKECLYMRSKGEYDKKSYGYAFTYSCVLFPLQKFPYSRSLREGCGGRVFRCSPCCRVFALGSRGR